MLHFQSYLPRHDGLLPIWLLFISAVAFLNSIQAYCSTRYTSRVYSGNTKTFIKSALLKSPVTPLSSRTFGTWTLIQSIVRLYAAYHITEPAFYWLSFLTFAVAFGHFMSEWQIYRTTRWGSGLAGPVAVSSGTMLWMILKKGYYIG
ncbi:Ergosterol biosynthetic protein 28 [Golovinomyces cichoracearum]|uniref:Ergosterol biosynthetic protein 28 n=1 Tax=Golovinomyces cichoracearum TaxID=62708 RepID=A0A420HXU2_9PEZI|nr:Ergosterol biosynthetic protein 28 [Golovinomyces cichoracearum]